jgi:peroxiredoxin family protein
MPGRVVFFLQSASFEPAYQAASLSITAAAMGDEVYIVFAFDALRQLVRGSYGQPRSEKEMAEATRAEGLNVPKPVRMLEEARSLGAKLIACDTTVKICGFTPAEIGQKLDEVTGLASIWRLTQGARVLSF